MADDRLDALAYPTIRRKANVAGQPQAGTNCHLSANSGLPAIVVPGGFTPDGLPVGVELLGRAWSESLLIKLAYAYEQATRHSPTAMTYACAFCGEENATFVDAGGGARQVYTEDCAVCCRPNLITVTLDADGDAQLEVTQEYEA